MGCLYLRYQNATRSLNGTEEEFAISERYADSAYVNNPPILAVYFEKGLDLFNKEYVKARQYFSEQKCKNSVLLLQTKCFHS